MRTEFGPSVERFRITSGQFESDPGSTYGAFEIPGPKGMTLRIIVGDGLDWEECGLEGEPWEHVSVSVPTARRCPTWEEMDFVKRAFWRDDETVVQLHVPRDRHISHHDYCLHLWRPTRTAIPLPPSLTVAPAAARVAP